MAPLISPDGAFGGPVRVAVNQTKALLELGHDVVLAAGARGFASFPEEFGGVPVRLFPARLALPGMGYAGLTAPNSLRWLLKSRADFDAVHVHMARDLLTLPLARTAQALGLKTFIQPHGMIDPSERALSRPLDIVLTRPVLQNASRVFHLTPQEGYDLRDVAGPQVRLTQLDNGVPSYDSGISCRKEREVICVARLQERKRPLDFIRMALALTDKHPDVKFTLIGPEEGEGQSVRSLLSEAGNPKNVQWEGPLAPELILPRISRAALYVQPSIHETFPMSVLEAMSTGTPVVLRESCGLAASVAEAEAGRVVDLTVGGLAAAVDELLNHEADLNRLGSNALEAASNRFGMRAVSKTLEGCYRA